MRWYDFIVLFVLFGLLFAGMYLLWLYLPTGYTEFEEYKLNLSRELPLISSQFHANMRFPDRNIAYSVSSNCSAKRRLDVERGIVVLEQRTVLNFYESNKSEMMVSCSNIAPEPQNEGHFVAGEGGPTIVINVSRYSVILNGEMALYRPETCDKPQIATHELLHVLGFDHNGNQSSIMFELTECDQVIDQYIVDEINRLYEEDSLPDLLIKSAKLNKTGRYLDFEINLMNYGLRSSGSFSLDFVVDGDVVESNGRQGYDIGEGERLTGIIIVPRKTKTITLKIETSQAELSKENNVVVVSALDGG